MAQILKDSLRNAIINAAKAEFLTNGYKEASMRKIAKDANMTVGNLYRYFDSKEAISSYIVSDTLKEIKNCLDSVVSDNVTYEKRVYAVQYDVADFRRMLDLLADKFVDIYYRQKDEFNILLSEVSLYEDILKRLEIIIENIIFKNYTVSDYEKQVKLIGHSYSCAIISGLKDLFRNADVSIDSLRNMAKIYLRGYVVILQADIGQLLGN